MDKALGTVQHLPVSGKQGASLLLEEPLKDPENFFFLVCFVFTLSKKCDNVKHNHSCV